MLRYCFQNDSLERLNPLWPLLSGFKILFDKIGHARPKARPIEPVAPLFFCATISRLASATTASIIIRKFK